MPSDDARHQIRLKRACSSQLDVSIRDCDCGSIDGCVVQHRRRTCCDFISREIKNDPARDHLRMRYGSIQRSYVIIMSYDIVVCCKPRNSSCAIGHRDVGNMRSEVIRIC